MLQFRAPVRGPNLVLIEGGADGDTSRDAARPATRRPLVLLVLVATAVAVLVDLVDTVPMWSHWAAAGTAAVLVTHALVTRRRAR